MRLAKLKLQTQRICYSRATFLVCHNDSRRPKQLLSGEYQLRVAKTRLQKKSGRVQLSIFDLIASTLSAVKSTLWTQCTQNQVRSPKQTHLSFKVEKLRRPIMSQPGHSLHDHRILSPHGNGICKNLDIYLCWL